jgi:hypothetical protein
MKSTNINFEKLEYPELCPKIVQYKDLTYYLTDRDDKWIKHLQYLYHNSSLHSNILNNLNQLVVGTGFIAETEQDKLVIESLEMDEILNDLVFDYNLYGGAYLFVKWNDMHTKIIEIDHIPYEQIRLGDVDEEADDIEVYYQCTNWAKWKQKTITPLVKFSTDPRSDALQVYPIKYNKLFVYPTPYYSGGLRNIEESVEIDKFYLHLVETGFIANTIISIPGHIDPEEEDAIKTTLKRSYTGSEGFKTIVLFPETPEQKIIIDKFNSEDDGKKYSDRENQVRQNIISVHGLTSPLLVGEKEAGQLGGSSEFEVALTIYNRRKVYPTRDMFLKMFNIINKYMYYPLSKVEIEDLEWGFAEKAMPDDNTDTNPITQNNIEEDGAI